MKNNIIMAAFAAALCLPAVAMADSASNLISIMIKKGMLTKEEGDVLMNELAVEKQGAAEASDRKKADDVAPPQAGAATAVKAAGINVTIYGVADVSFEMANTGSTPAGLSGVKSKKISSNTSLIGFRGEESIGDGLKAIWQIESEIDLDGTNAAGASAGSANNAMGFATRNTYAGLKSDSFGTLLLGRHDTPYKTSDRRLDLFGNHVADNRALMGGGAGVGSGDAKGYDKRATDTAVYNSPVMNGFKVMAAYVAGSENNTLAVDAQGNIVSLAGTYDMAPFYGVLAYQRNSFGTAAKGVVGAANGASANTSENAMKLGGGYKAEQFTINAIYEKTDDNFGGGAGAATAYNGACAGVALGGSCYGHKAYYLAGQYNITPSDAVKLAYTKADNLQNGKLANSGARHVSVGYDHKLGKRTNIYATYTKLNNDTKARYDLKGEVAATGNVFSQAPGASPSSFALGMMHTF